MNSEFDELLKPCKAAIERFVFYKLPSRQDGEDVLQEVYYSAVKNFHALRDKSKFKAWMLSIAANQCNVYYKRKARQYEIPLEDVYVYEDTHNKMGIGVKEVVRETISYLADKDKQIIYLYYFKNMSQRDIASRLSIPIGTVKSRLYTAKQNFREHYPYMTQVKGDVFMGRFPGIMPDVKITESNEKPFEVIWEELMGWFIIPKLGEKLKWASYDYPSRKQTEFCSMCVTGKTAVHGVEGVEIQSKDSVSEESDAYDERIFAAQITDTHCRFLSESHYEGDVKHVNTFLDDKFIPNWGIGDDNCGNEIYLKQKGIIKRSGDYITCPDLPVVLDVVGRYTVEIGEKSFDTILAVNIDFSSGIMTETYLDKNGRTVLWRRFNRDDWAFSHYKQIWSERLPQNERVSINGETYVHWYSCITDYIL